MFHSLKIPALNLPALNLLLLLAVPTLAQDEDAVRTLAKAEFERQELVGLAMGVIQDGELAYTAYFGWEDREAEIPVGKETLFRWASISKPITAVAALQLARADALDLDADVREYVPEFPDKDVVVTSRQLMGHLGGVVHYSNGKVIKTKREYDDPHPFRSVILALDTFRESPLVADPGTQFAYTTHGYILLSAAVERAGKGTYWEQVQERITEPLGLETLQPDYPWVELDHRAAGYHKVFGGVQMRRGDDDVSWKLGGGGYISSVEDLAGFAAGLLGDELLTKEEKQLAWTAARVGGKSTGYGLGFSIDGKVIGHSGAQSKTRTMMRLVPEEGLGVVLMTNSEWARLGGLATELVAELRKRP